VKGIPWPTAAIVGLISAMFFLGGMFMSSMAVIMLLMPIVLPVIMHLQLNLIWFGVMVVLLTETGVITPPVGINVFVVKGIANDVPLERVFKGTLPFLGAIVVLIVILIFFPGIATFLPSLMAR
jgi:C4-dicarboxylate transporter, DctM subunit